MDEAPNPYMKRSEGMTPDQASRFAIAWEIRKLREMLEPFARAMKLALLEEGIYDDQEGQW